MSESLTVASEPEWAAFAAIDWADQKNFWRLIPAGSQRQEQGELENTPEAVEVWAWAATLHQRFGGRPIAVCLEQSRGALVYMLAKYAHLVLFPVHPTTAARYRETFCTSGAKADPSDTASLLDLLLRHRERLRQLRPDTTETRLLQFLVEARRRTVDEATRQSNRLTDCLKLYFPQILRWFGDVASPLVGDLLKRWPTLDELQRAHPGTLHKFFHQHNCRGEERIQERIQSIYQATSATQDAAVLEAGGHDRSWPGGFVGDPAQPNRGFRTAHRGARAFAPGRRVICISARGRRRAGPAFDRGLRNVSRSLRKCLPVAVLQRDSTGEGGQRKNRMDPFPFYLRQVSTPDISRVCQSLDRAVRVGKSLLRAPAERPEEVPSCGGQGAGI